MNPATLDSRQTWSCPLAGWWVEPWNPELQADMIMPISRLVSRAHHAATVQYCSLLHRHWRMGYMWLGFIDCVLFHNVFIWQYYFYSDVFCSCECRGCMKPVDAFRTVTTVCMFLNSSFVHIVMFIPYYSCSVGTIKRSWRLCLSSCSESTTRQRQTQTSPMRWATCWCFRANPRMLSGGSLPPSKQTRPA